MVALTISGTSSRPAACWAARTPSAAARQQPRRLHLVPVHDVVERHVAGDGNRARRGTHGADNEPVAGGLTREAGGDHAQLVRAIGEPILAEHVRRAAEGVRRDDIRARG
jgi:hypothetical protein